MIIWRNRLKKSDCIICCCATSGSGISSRVVTPEVNEIVVNPNATLDWQLALRRAAGKTDLARDMLQMLLDFLPEVRNKVEEQLVGENPEGWLI